SEADRCIIRDADFLRLFAYPEPRACRVCELWQFLVEEVAATQPSFAEWSAPLGVIARDGCLARRIARALAPHPSPERLREVYDQLARCLAGGQPFAATP